MWYTSTYNFWVINIMLVSYNQGHFILLLCSKTFQNKNNDIQNIYSFFPLCHYA